MAGTEWVTVLDGLLICSAGSGSSGETSPGAKVPYFLPPRFLPPAPLFVLAGAFGFGFSDAL